MPKITVVQLFVTCMIETIKPEIGIAVVEVLERLGVRVCVPDGQTCCGQPAFNGGFWEDARAMARHTIDVLSRSPAPVVVPSGSCADMIQNHYPELLAEDPEYGPKAVELSQRIYEFSEFLVDGLGYNDVGAVFPGKLTYHASCHTLRGKGVDRQPRLLLAHVKDAEFVELPGAEECCGFGGLFAVKMSDISGAMVARKIENIKKTQADTLVTCEPSCLINISSGLHRREIPTQVLHIAEILRSTQGGNEQ
jgi:L-lactate dehydrogenase complex protein LldE